VAALLYALLIVVLLAGVALSIWWARRLRPSIGAREDGFIAHDSEDLREAVESGRSALRTVPGDLRGGGGGAAAGAGRDPGAGRVLPAADGAESGASPQALRPQVRVLAAGAALLALGAGAGMLPAAGPGAGSALLRLVAAGALIAAAGLVLPYVARDDTPPPPPA